MRKAILIPTFNEESRIKQVLLELDREQFEVIVVDDGSTDNTVEQIGSVPGVGLLRHEDNQGQGAALRTGMNYLIERGVDVVVHFDGDAQHDPHGISDLIRPILDEQCEVVFGSRFLTRESRKLVPRSKRVILRLARWFEFLRTGVLLSDAHCGFRAMSRKAMERIDLQCNGPGHASEIVSQVHALDLRYVEVPVAVRYHHGDYNLLSDIRRIGAVLKELVLRKK